MTEDRQRGTILVVDDNLDIRGLAQRFLELAGYTVITAADGEEGLCFYEKHQSSIVLLLTDVAMPKVNGFELADRVHAMDLRLPVLFMSGDAGCDYRDSECLAKPFRPVDLMEAVSRTLYATTQVKSTASAA
jgi:CheY-like chemotaxis protein